LAQTFGDFELVISDNDSADGTRAICEQYAARDKRIRYVRQPRNIGAVRNWDYVARVARTPFFKWSSANDLCHPQMLEKCVDVLRRDAGVVLCYGRTCLIDSDDKELGIYPHDLAFEQTRPSERFISVRNRMNLNNAFQGVVRREILQRTRLVRLYPDGDMVLMAELALYGAYRRLPDTLLYRRMDPGSASRYLSPQQLREFLDPDTAHKGYTAWRRHFDCTWTILRSGVSWSEKGAALDFALRSAYWDRRALWRELRFRGR